jgi:ferredoxin, 2Fe-2S
MSSNEGLSAYRGGATAPVGADMPEFRLRWQGDNVPRIVFINPDGEQREVAAEAGESVMQAALNNLVDGIVGECGGDLSCATCHVFVDPEWFDSLPEVCDEEADMLEATSEEPTKFSRLACQIRCTSGLDGLVVHTPATQRL